MEMNNKHLFRFLVFLFMACMIGLTFLPPPEDSEEVKDDGLIQLDSDSIEFTEKPYEFD
jgi:hypothetical protein